MRRRDFLLSTAAVAASPMALGPRSSFAQAPSPARWEAAMQTQERFGEAVKAGLGDHYIAPLHTDGSGPHYLWGGLDPIAMVASYDRQIGQDKGRIVYLWPWPNRAELGKPEFALDVPIYRGGPTKLALFASAENRDQFERQFAEGTFMVMCGMNCMWGVACNPATQDRPTPQASHWAQPGLGSISVDKFPDANGREVITVASALYFKADDWHAVRAQGWEFAAESLQTLLDTNGPWRRLRPYLPVLTLG